MLKVDSRLLFIVPIVLQIKISDHDFLIECMDTGAGVTVQGVQSSSLNTSTFFCALIYCINQNFKFLDFCINLSKATQMG